MNVPSPSPLSERADTLGIAGAAHAPLIVLGMHRSGTSLVARILSELGVHIGAKLDRHNEAICFKQVNQVLLQSQGADWARPEPFVSHLSDNASLERDVQLALDSLVRWSPSYGEIGDDQLWGWKDPRNTLTLPVWLAIFPDARVIHVVRNGLDVALSLHRREPRRLIQRLRGKPARETIMVPPTISRGYALWSTYVRLALDLEALGTPWFTLRYEELVLDPGAAIARLVQFLGIEVDAEKVRGLGGGMVRMPAHRSLLEGWRLNFLLRTGILDPQPLRVLGYEPGI